MKIKELYYKYKELVNYVFFGGLTTFVNWISYIVLVRLFGGESIAAAVSAATAIAQVLSILFAYVTNRKWVFESRVSGFVPILLEMLKFFGARAVTAVLDVILMYIGVTLAGFNGTIMKLLSNIVIIILNYFFSKLIVFRKKADKQNY